MNIRIHTVLGSMMNRRIAVGALLAASCLWSGTAVFAQIDVPVADCLDCHGEEDAEPFVDGEHYLASVHGDETCTSCHSDITDADHDTPLKKVDCAECHDVESEMYLQSSHGLALVKDRDMATTCQDCHGDAHRMEWSDELTSPINRTNITETCASCHADVEMMREFGLHQLLPIASYTNSVHGRALGQDSSSAAAVCTDCHGSHNLQRATLTDSKLHWGNIADTCGKCHEDTAESYLRSVHGEAILEGNRDAPVCTDCHGEHNITLVANEDSQVFTSHIADTCGQCHAAERIVSKYRMADHTVDSYMDSYHGLAVRLGSLTTANCGSCHGKHDILPSMDPRSSIHKDNLSETCGVCHAGVDAHVAQGRIHAGAESGMEHQAVSLVRSIYTVLFVVVLGGMLFHNALDLIRKLRKHFKEMKALGTPLRMSLNQRLQHAILVVTFVTLAYTGFALVYPDTWWASIFVSHVDWRGYGHRLAAVLFIILCIYHFWFTTFTRRGRYEIKHLAIRLRDVREFGQMMGYYLGLRKERAQFGRYSYVEKAEYWALVWGSMLMAVTGAFMTYEELALRYYPKWLYDVITAIHYYEAILACFAVIIWHFYWVMIDPDEYPVKVTCVTGREGHSDLEREPTDDPPPS